MRTRIVALVLGGALVAGATAAALSSGNAAPRGRDERASPAAPTTTAAALPTEAPARQRTPTDAGPDTDSVSAADAEPATEGTLVIWGRGDLTRDFADAVAALPQVTAVAHVRSTTLGLVGSRTAAGAAGDVLGDGFQIPVSVAAIEPSAYAATLPPGVARDAVVALAPGQVLLSETGARLRGIGVVGHVDLAALPGLEVIGVIADDSVGRSEIVLHAADGTAAGLPHDGTVFLRHDAAPGADTVALTRQIEALVPADVTARIVDVAAGEPRRRAPLVLSLAQVKDRFGEFAFRPRPGAREIDVDPAFPADHIVTVEVPILGSVTCHEGIVDDLRGALQEVVAAGLAADIDPGRYAGCYYPRRISTSSARLSHHSWGIALDINVDLSHPDLGPPPQPGIIAAFEAHGFRWGGDFLQPDNHHFEWVGDLTESPSTEP